jgi:hypothetical protein
MLEVAPTSNIVYLSHGSQKFYDQTTFSVMTLLWRLIQANRGDIQIVIFTDQIRSAPQHPLVKVVEITRDELRRYKGRFDYVHRIKHCILLKASQELTGPILYVDCDTRWLEIPDQALDILKQDHGAITPHCCMHEIDGAFSETHFPDYHRYITEHAEELKAQGIHHLDRLLNWNAGAIGLPEGNTRFFEDALKISDFVFTKVKPRNWVEQFAWSLVGCDRYQMFALGDCLHHYWGYSYEAPIYLRQFFKSLPPNLSVEELAKACATHEWSKGSLIDIQKHYKHVWIRRWNKFKNSIKKRKVEAAIKQQRN